MKIDTQQEKDNFMVQQWQHFNNTYMAKLTLSCKYKENLDDVKQILFYEDLTIPVPTKKHIENLNYLNMIAQDVLQHYRQSDLVWFLLKC